MTSEAAFDVEVKQAMYALLANTARMPESRDVARALSVPEPDVRVSFARLHAQRLLLPEPGDPSRIRMAPPFSGVPTTFQVRANGRRYDANCVWDALGIPAALHVEGVVDATDAHTGEPLELEVGRDGPDPRPWVAHFAVPAARWWEDLVYT